MRETSEVSAEQSAGVVSRLQTEVQRVRNEKDKFMGDVAGSGDCSSIDTVRLR